MHRQGRFDVALFAIVELNPIGFFVRFDRWVVFSQRPFESNDAVEVAVCQVMRDLPNGPVLVGSIKLRRGQTIRCGSQSSWSVRNR